MQLAEAVEAFMSMVNTISPPGQNDPQVADQAVEILEGGVTNLERDGWTRGAGRIGGPQCCGNAVVDSWYSVYTRMNPEAYRMAWAAMHAAVTGLGKGTALQGAVGGSSVVIWNDGYCGSQDEAIDMLRAAIKNIRKEQA